jgi:hypothetical protein
VLAVPALVVVVVVNVVLLIHVNGVSEDFDQVFKSPRYVVMPVYISFGTYSIVQCEGNDAYGYQTVFQHEWKKVA